MNLPMGSILPMEITTKSLTEFSESQKLQFLPKNNYLIFVKVIPLLSNEKYTVYHPIPLSIPHTDRTIVLIDTEVEYLALSSDNEKFFTLSTEQWEKCKSLGLGKLCKHDLLIHHRLGSVFCEVSLLTKPQHFPKT